MWQTGDPRLELSNMEEIVIIRRSLNGRGWWESGTGKVGPHVIWTSFAGHVRLIGEYDLWNEYWLWTLAPQ